MNWSRRWDGIKLIFRTFFPAPPPNRIGSLPRAFGSFFPPLCSLFAEFAPDIISGFTPKLDEQRMKTMCMWSKWKKSGEGRERGRQQPNVEHLALSGKFMELDFPSDTHVGPSIFVPCFRVSVFDNFVHLFDVNRRNRSSNTKRPF